jgi:hypothetical protein
LKGHVALPKVKETHFFKNHYSNGMEWYDSLFTDVSPGMRVGEICPDYFNSAPACERIAKELPNCKIICGLRDPVERLYSYYRKIRPLWGIDADLEGTLDLYPDMMKEHCCASRLSAWQDKFGRENVLVLFYQDLKVDAQSYLDSVCAFINIPKINLESSPVGRERVNNTDNLRAPWNRRLALASGMVYGWLRDKRFNRTLRVWQKSPLWQFCLGGGKPYGPLSPETEERLREYFRPDVDELEQLTQRDLSAWKHPIAVETEVRARDPRRWGASRS